MDKIMSTRIEESVIQQIAILAKKLNTTKKAIIENAIQHYAEKIAFEQDIDILGHTCGIWQREEPPADTIQNIKDKMRQSQERYRR
jgi:hypothetical protein